MAEHVPVLLAESVAFLAPKKGEVHVDCTLGRGGHAEALLEAGECTVIGLDRDPLAIAESSARLARFGDRFVPVRSRFSELPAALAARGISQVHGLLADLGVSSPQLDDPARGFSFRAAGPVDMRMDPDAPVSAADLVNHWPEAELAAVIKELGEERHARRVAAAIVAGRPWTDTLGLAGAIARVVGKGQGRIHPATRTFQALRMAVNDELGELRRLLAIAPDLLAPCGRLAVITFHSLEDRLVKQAIAHEAGKGAPRDPYGQVMVSVRLRPGREHVPAPTDDNPRARSARLRTATRLPCDAR